MNKPWPIQVNNHLRISISDTHEDDFIRDQVTLRLDIKLPKRAFIEASSAQDAVGPLIDAVKRETDGVWEAFKDDDDKEL